MEKGLNREVEDRLLDISKAKLKSCFFFFFTIFLNIKCFSYGRGLFWRWNFNP